MKFLLVSIVVFGLAQNNCAKAQAKRTVADSITKQIAKAKAATKKQAAKMQFQYFVTKAESGTFGYDIYADGKLYLHQNTIPAVGGNNGFADTAAAGVTARLAIKKIRQGEIPPTISIDELKKLKIITP